MIDILLAKLEPLQSIEHGCKYLKEDEIIVVKLSDNESVSFSVAHKYYVGSSYISDAITDIQEELDINFGGGAVVIDLYPKNQFDGGVEPSEISTGLRRYELKCVNSPSSDVIILLCPDFEPIILADLNFAYYGDAQSIEGGNKLIFGHQSVLSVKTGKH